MRPRRRIPGNVSVPTGVSTSTVKIGSACGKPLGNTHINSQSDCQGYLSDSVIFDGKPSGEKSQETDIMQTQAVVQAGGLPGFDIGGTHLNLSGKPNNDTHLSGLPMLVDLTRDKNIIDARNNNKRQRTNETLTYLTNVEQYLQTTEEEDVIEKYECCIEEEDGAKACHSITTDEKINILRAMNSEKRAVDIMNNKLWHIGVSTRRLSTFYQGMKDVHRIRKSKGIPKLNYEIYTDPEHYYLQPVYRSVSPQIKPDIKDYQRGLEAMRYYDDIESMKVEMDDIQLITTNSQLTYTGPALVKFQKMLSVANDHRNKNGEIR